MADASYEGRRVVVTGCASGIGECLAELLLGRGAEVVGLDRHPSAVVAEFHRVDLADSDSIGTAAAAIGDPVDALFNVAGIAAADDPATVVEVNFVGTRELTAALVPRMRPGAAIVNTASIAASRYMERRGLVEELLATADRDAARAWCEARRAELGSGYSISKDAIVWHTLHRAVELAAAGIRMNAVAPGLTETPILAGSRGERDASFFDAIPMPLGRVADPREQAAVMAFLGSDDAAYVNGQIIWADGGYTVGIATGRFENVTGFAGA